MIHDPKEFCRSEICFPGVFPRHAYLRDQPIEVMRDILQSRYLHSNVAHKQLARTSFKLHIFSVMNSQRQLRNFVHLKQKQESKQKRFMQKSFLFQVIAGKTHKKKTTKKRKNKKKRKKYLELSCFIWPRIEKLIQLELNWKTTKRCLLLCPFYTRYW